MTVTINEIDNRIDTNFVLYDLTCGKRSAAVFVHTGCDPHVRVIVKNAAHSALRGSGKRFATAADAISAYKSDAVKAMIATAAEMA